MAEPTAPHAARSGLQEEAGSPVSPPALPPDDRFIPVRAEDLARTLARDDALRGPELQGVFEKMGEVAQAEASALAAAIGLLYARFDPDSETLPCGVASTPDESGHAQLRNAVEYLLEKANFCALSDVQIEQAILAANTHGISIRVDPERVQELSLWVRGLTKESRTRRTPRHPIKGERVEVELYRRLVVVARLRDEHCLRLKMFREIPVPDIEALLPHAEVGMNWWDRIRVWAGGAGALGTVAWKIATGAALLTSGFAWLVASGLALMTLRTFFGYRRARVSRDWQRTRHLYYQNMANNVSVVSTLVAKITQEEWKEGMLAYALSVGDGRGVAGVGALRERAETYLKDRFGATVDFDAQDAVETLERLGLRENATDGHSAIRVLTPEEALRLLSTHASNGSARRYHAERIARRAATAPRIATRRDDDTPSETGAVAVAAPQIADAGN